MSQQIYGKTYGGSAPENYERYFVPAIGAPIANDLIESAALQPGERVLDVACGTGVVTRLAAQKVGSSGSVAGLDVNPGMLAVARSAAPSGLSIDWYETSAEAMPLADAAFDAVLCQMGLQFFPSKLAAIREMRRVLAPGGRVVINVPGPTPVLFARLADALARHVGPEVASFVHVVFSLHDAGELRELLNGAGFHDVAVRAAPKTLRLPPARDFLWQYVHSTPLATAVASMDERRRAALERDVCEQWQEFAVDDAMTFSVGITTASGKT